MKTEAQIEILMKTFSLEWEQAALITLAIKRMKERMNNGNYGKVQIGICQEDSKR